jgi:MoaA/NifB/PqqE/SkfB family radical SAM enzyme
MSLTERTFKNYKGHGVSLLHHWKTHGYEFPLLPIRKPLNILHGLYEWKSHKSVLKSMPFLVRLNTSEICNLRCSCCRLKNSFNLKPGQSRDQYVMNLDTFDKVLSQTGAHAQRMTFHISGEPMMNPNLFKMVRKAHERKVFTYFSTNFNLMTPALLPELFESGLDKLRICFDGFSQEVYETYRVGGDVEKLRQAIAMTMEEKRRRGAPRPVVEVQIILFAHVQPEVDQIKRFCKEQGVDQIIMIPDGCNFDGSHVLTVQGKPYTGCFWPWLNMVLNFDGAVYPCGQGFDGRIPYGNVNRESVASIWNNELFTETRRFLSGKSPRRADLNLQCYNCPDGFGYQGPVVMSKGEPYLHRKVS